MNLPTITTQLSTPYVGFSIDTTASRCPVCSRTFEGCTCTSTITGLTAQTFDDGSDACPICGYWICRCNAQTAPVQPILHQPGDDHRNPPSLDIAMELARAALDRHAGADIFDGTAMMQAAASLDFVLRDVLAALDAEASR